MSETVFEWYSESGNSYQANRNGQKYTWCAIYWLPNGKIVQWNNALYESNKLRILTQTDYNNLNNSINNSVKNIFTTGTYIGNSNYPRTINIGFTPSALIIDITEYDYHEGLSSRMTLNGYGIFNISDDGVYIEIVANGFRVGSGYKNFNQYNKTYSYIAFN